MSMSSLVTGGLKLSVQVPVQLADGLLAIANHCMIRTEFCFLGIFQLSDCMLFFKIIFEIKIESIESIVVELFYVEINPQKTPIYNYPVY